MMCARSSMHSMGRARGHGEQEISFQEFGIQARILSVEGPKLKDENHLEFPIKVREKRDVHLKDE